ncbi:MAG: hypothetical protein M3298_01750, partial [Thermoproteota archaeon]|nr:hypothetical protein [Thermoproteota archaeon]
VYAVYVQKESKIYAINSDVYYNPFIVLHELYHHIRTKGGIHRGSEKNANLYARSFIDAYNRTIKQMTESHVGNNRNKKGTGTTTH